MHFILLCVQQTVHRLLCYAEDDISITRLYLSWITTYPYLPSVGNSELHFPSHHHETENWFSTAARRQNQESLTSHLIKLVHTTICDRRVGVTITLRRMENWKITIENYIIKNNAAIFENSCIFSDFAGQFEGTFVKVTKQ